MPIKDPEKRRAAMRAWYARTKQTRRTAELVGKERATKRARRHALASWLAEVKQQLVCARCGEDHPGCLQFHHADPDEKEISVAIAISRGWSRARIEREILKCEVLCANCHAKHHARDDAHV